MAKAKGTVLGKTAREQLGRMVRQWEREGSPPLPTAKQPVNSPNWARWGTLQADLSGNTTTPVTVQWVYFQRNESDSGTRGSWVPVLDVDGKQLTFLVIEGGLYPSSKKLAAGTKVVCTQVARDLWAPINANNCPVGASLPSL